MSQENGRSCAGLVSRSLLTLLVGASMRMPPRLRRLLTARRMWQAYAAANRRDFDSVLVGWDPASEYHPSADLIAPDQEAVFYGHDGYRQLWRYWLDAFQDIRWDPRTSSTWERSFW